MSSSGSCSSALSHESESSREATPPSLYHLHNNLAPTYWDDEDWEFSASSDGEAKTDGEAVFEFLVHGDLAPYSDDDLFSWDGGDELVNWSPRAAETEDDAAESEEEFSPIEPPWKRFRWGSTDDDEDEDEEPPIVSSSDEEDTGSSADGSGGNEEAGRSPYGSRGDDEDGDGDDEDGF